jgi:CO/xanthine dehydrogenase Mo-binding subunit
VGLYERGKRPPSASALGEADVRVAHSDTDLAPDGGSTYASRTAVLGGSAATMAADKIIAKAKKVAAHALEAAAAAYAPRRGGRGGIGQAFTEHLVYDGHSGQPLSGSLMDYGLPRVDEVCSVDVDENPMPTKTNPLGVKGAGEAGNVGALAAIINAVVDALSSLGVTISTCRRHPKKSGARSEPPEPAPDPDSGEAEPGQA